MTADVIGGNRLWPVSLHGRENISKTGCHRRGRRDTASAGLQTPQQSPIEPQSPAQPRQSHAETSPARRLTKRRPFSKTREHAVWSFQGWKPRHKSSNGFRTLTQARAGEPSEAPLAVGSIRP